MRSLGLVFGFSEMSWIFSLGRLELLVCVDVLGIGIWICLLGAYWREGRYRIERVVGRRNVGVCAYWGF